MEPPLCEICEQRAAKLKCEDCEVFLCHKDSVVHKDCLPEYPHHIVLLKAKARPAAPAYASPPSVSEELPEPIIPSYAPPPPVPSHIPADPEPMEVEPEEAIPSEFEASAVPSHSADRQGELGVHTIFHSHVDVSQSFKLYKWMLNRREAEGLVREMAAAGRPVKVIGIYGPEEVAVRVIGSAMSMSEEKLMVPEETKEGIVAYYRADTSMMCFYFKIEQESTYLASPYPTSSREAVYLRLLFDVCPIVICCISEEIQRNWYWASDSQRKNPFLPKTHKGMLVKIDRRKVESSEIEEILVIPPATWRGACSLTSDHWPYLFHADLITKDFSRQSNAAIEKFKAWLSYRKPSGHYGWSTFLSSYYGYDTGSFHTFTSSLKAVSSESEGVINTVKEKFEGLKKVIAGEAEQFFSQLFFEPFLLTFEVKNEYQKYYVKTVSFADFHAKMWEECVVKREYRQLHTYSREAKEFVIGVKDKPKVEKDELSSTVTIFFEQKEKEILTQLEAGLNAKFRAFEEEQIELILQLASRNRELCSINTYVLDITEDSIRVRDKEIENRFSLRARPSSVSFHVLDKEAAFAMAEGVCQTVKFNPSASYTYEIEELYGVKTSVLIASGSTVSQFVAFYNEEQRAIYGAAQEMKGIDKGIPLKVYGEAIHQVTSACVLQKTRRLLLLNEQGAVYFIELVSSGKCLTPVMVDRKEERFSEEGMPLEPENVRRPLIPVYGRAFYDIKSSDDETLYFFLTDSAIEIYDLNYIMVKAIGVSDPSVSFKVLSSEAYNIIITQSGSELRAFRFQSEMERVERTVVESLREVVPGNPIIDILYHAFFKFGYRNPASDSKSLFYLYMDSYNQQCEDYFKSIPLLTQALTYGGTITPTELQQLADFLASNYSELEVEDIKWRLLTRAPLHLCSIQDGNLIPLQDGLNNFEEFIGQISESKTDFVTAFVSYIRLGGMESIIREADNVKVVAIIGRQSSGKSYLLNRLFGTRFDVAAHRCTDGIWLSLSRVQNQTFLILDCEGLFSVERSVQEEIKLCLLLAAIADVTILNQDLTFNRNLSFLFEKFTFGIDRLKGSKLFKGCLEIAIRDVAANQDDGANAEVRKFVDKMIEANRADFLIKLFGGVFMCCSYHNFENEQLFEAAVVSRRQLYLEDLKVRWTSGEEFLIILKTVMAQIYADDATSIDSRTFQLKLGKVSAAMKKAIEMPSAAKELVSPANPTVSVAFYITGYAFAFELGLFDLEISLSSRYMVFNEFMQKHVPAEAKLYEHNAWYEALEGFMKAYFDTYKTTLFSHFEKNVAVTDEFRPIFEGEKNILEKMFDNVLLLSHTLCRRKCKFCDLHCVKPQNHPENCDCSTSHKCLYPCSICAETDMCSQNAGHTGSHLCASKPHTCGLPCELRSCKGTCTAAPNHGDTHRCSAATHPCGAECSAFHVCKRTCEIDQVVPHIQHNCGQSSCPFPCGLCRGEFISPCMSQNHLHFLSTDPEDITSPETGQILHFCSKEHPCSTLCEVEGVCDIESVTEKRVWVNEFNSFSYSYVSQKAIKLKCSTQIPIKATRHAEGHHCNNEDHKCVATCPDCGAYCEASFGHEGLHSSAAHRNKERCIYVAKSEGIEYEIEEESKRTTRKLKAGESAKPEFCDQSCVRKGRGHTHPMECRGGTSCLQVACSGRAIHSKDKYYPDLDRVFDLVECETYWKLKGWEPPVFKKSPAAQDLFAFCPFYCASAEHSERVYCEGRLFHSSSLAYKDHQFSSCAHTSSSELDISFILDCTGSMSSCFPQVKEVITQVIDQYKGTELSNKFAIVGYTDHAPDNGNFPVACPVSFYPASKQLKDFEITSALAYLTSLQASGGGSMYGEAMLDGMNVSNSLVWREHASRLVFIIGDDCPHGDVFAPGTKYPSGCPCGLSWKALLATMKAKKTEIRFVNLNSIMNKTVDLFKLEYGEGFEVISLGSMTNISTAVVKSIVAVIEHNLEFALD